MTTYSFTLLQCQQILSKNICLNNISSIDNSIILSIGSTSYKLFINVEYYLDSIYVIINTIDITNNIVSIGISECQSGFKMINGICTRVIPTPIGDFTEGDLILIGIGIPSVISIASLIKQ